MKIWDVALPSALRIYPGIKMLNNSKKDLKCCALESSMLYTCLDPW